MTLLEHSDYILKAKPGEWLLACAPVSAVNMHEGGRIDYPIGARFRAKFECADLLWCLDEEARSITFGRRDMIGLERAPKREKETRRER